MNGFLEVTHIVIVPDLGANIAPESPCDRAIQEGSLVDCDNGRDICNLRGKDLEGHLFSRASFDKAVCVNDANAFCIEERIRISMYHKLSVGDDARWDAFRVQPLPRQPGFGPTGRSPSERINTNKLSQRIILNHLGWYVSYSCSEPPEQMGSDESVRSWLANIPTSCEKRVLTASYISPPPSFTPKRRKTSSSKRMDFEQTPRPQKQRKRAYHKEGVESNESGSSASGLTSESYPSLPHAIGSSPSRPISPTRDLINQLRSAHPSIQCNAIESPLSSESPIAVQELLKNLAAGFGENVIPRKLRVCQDGSGTAGSKVANCGPHKPKIEAASPFATAFIPTNAWMDDSDVFLEAIWDQVAEILDEAICCVKYQRDENAWCSKVVHPLMSLALGRSRTTMLQWENV